MKVDKGLKDYLRGKNYVLLTIINKSMRIILNYKGRIIIWIGINNILAAIKYAQDNNWHPVLIRYREKYDSKKSIKNY